MYKIEGLENWGLLYAPKSRADPDYDLFDYSFETFMVDFGTPNSMPVDWATKTMLHLDAPWPIGMKTGNTALVHQFYTPSQHTYHGKHYDVEMHLVFGTLADPNATWDRTMADEDDQFFNVVMHFDRHHGGNMDNPFVTTVLDAWRTRDKEGEMRVPMDFSLLAHQLMDAEDFVSYVGSSTVIGCGGGITIAMPSKVMTISDFQLAELQKFAPENVNGTRGNNRATQPRDLQSFPVF